MDIEKSVQNLITYISNIEVNNEKQYKDISKRLGEVETALKDILALEQSRRVYTGAELAEMKKSLSWQNLSKKTGIPLSTCQYRVRQYISKVED